MKVEKQKIKNNHKKYEMLYKYAQLTNNLYNHTLFIVRQNYFKNKKEDGNRKYIDYNKMYHVMKNTDVENRVNLPADTGNLVIKQVHQNWSSYFASIKEFKKNPSKFKGLPKHPGYNKKSINGGLYQVILPSPGLCRLKDDGYIHLSKKWFGDFKIKPYVMPLDAKLKQVRFNPNGDGFDVEIIYDDGKEYVDKDRKSNRIASIDIGLNNLLTVTTNVGIDPLIISGREIKSKNKYFNNKIAQLKSDLDNCQNKKGTISKQQRVGTSKQIKKLWRKRHNIMETFLHKASRAVVDYCVENDIDTLVVGHNKGQKQGSNLKNFVQIPVFSIIGKLEYKCQDANIKFVTVEEPYTSGTSFMDDELPVKENYDKERRVERGLFKTNNGQLINSDVNGSLQIMKRAFPNVEFPSDKSFVFNPVTVKL